MFNEGGERMKKSKRYLRPLTPEEHAKAEEERARPYRMEITDMGNDTFSVKSPILLHKDRLDLLKKICEITDEYLQHYIEQALLQRVQIDLENPSQFGQEVCKTLLEQWGPTK